MKTIVLAATLAALSFTLGAPLQAAATAPLALALQQSLDGSVERRGCDTPRDIREHPRCTRP